jgi:hypothetical protein
MNLSTGRVLIIVALIVAGLAVLANGFADEGTAAASPSGSPSGGASSPPATTGSPTTTTPPTQTPAPQKTGVLFMALNGTDVPGAGAAAQELLIAAGYKKVQEAANAPTSGVKKTTVYYRPDDTGQNQSDANYVARKYFNGALVKELDTDIKSAVPDSADLVVVVGDDYAQDLVSASPSP